MKIKKSKYFKRNLFLKTRKGSHVGFMISFAIFILFLVFAYTTIGYGEVDSETKENAMTNLEINFMKEIMEEVVIVSVYENQPDYDCVNFDAGNFENYSNYVVKANGTNVDASKSEGILKMEYNGEATLFKIYFSNESFNNSGTTNTNCIESSIKSVQKRKEIFEEEIISLKEAYESYNTLKNTLNIPLERDFSFEFEYSNGTILQTREKNISGDVYVKEIPINYFDRNGNYLDGKLRLKIW